MAKDVEIVRLPHLFKPRIYQSPCMQAFFYGEIKKLDLVWHRRAGKDLTCVNILVPAVFQRVGTYIFMLPQQNQARRVIWNGMDGAGIPFLARIPKQLVAKKNNQEMSIDFINGSKLYVGGSNNYNAWVGSNPIGIIASEFPLHTPLARQYFAPILAENGGWEIVEGTPRGKNHAYDVYRNATTSTDWYTQLLTVEDTFREDGRPVISQEDIERERRGGMSEEMIRQEFYCDWNVGLIGSYYTKEIDLAEKEGRIGYFEIDASAPVYTFWDIGVHDSTAIWWMQPKDGMLNMIYYYEATDQGIEHFIEKLKDVQQQLGFRRYDTHYGPHDIANREWGSNARSRLNIAIQKGLTFNVVQASSIEDGIQAVRSLFGRVRFHVANTSHGIECLREYRRKYDEVNKVFMTAPLHNWASNGADAFRYFAVKWSDLFTRPNTGPIKYVNGF